MLGPGERDVAEPELLDGLVCLGRLRQLDDRRLVVAPQLWDVGGIAPQRRGQHLADSGPLRAGPVDRELLCAHTDQEHRGPLETLGTVHGQQLHRVGLGRRRLVEPTAHLVLGLQPRQQGGQSHLAVDGLEVGHRLDEQVEVVAASGGGRRDRRGELDVDAGGVDDAPDQVEQGLTDVAPEHAQLLGEQPEAHAGLLGVVVVTRVHERVVERDDLGRVGALDGALQLLRDADALLAQLLAGQGPRAPAQQGEVARSDRPPRSVEQVEQVGVGGQVLEQRQGGDNLRHLGQPHQALQTDDLDRDLARGQRVEDVGRVAVVAGQYADLVPSRAPPSCRGWRGPARPASRARRRRSRARRPARFPGAASSLAVSGATWSKAAYSGCASALATSRIVVSERRFTVSEYVATSAPGPGGKKSAKLRMLETEAPRQP